MENQGRLRDHKAEVSEWEGARAGFRGLSHRLDKAADSSGEAWPIGHSVTHLHLIL